MSLYNSYRPYMQSHLVRTENSQTLINLLQKAINGQYSAIICYKKLIEMAPTEEEKYQIREIRNDEKRHLKEFSDIFENMTGQKPEMKVIEECPDTYYEGLKAAFKDEQVTADFYLDIAEKARDNDVKETFLRASADEQNHAVWFLYYLMTNKKSNKVKTMWNHVMRQNAQNYGAIGALNAPSLTFPQMLTYAIQDEYLAHSTYEAVNQKFGNLRPFSQIQQSELRHIDALVSLFNRYQIPVPPDDSKAYVTVPETFREALEEGVQTEINNIAMYDRYLTYNLPQNARNVFTNLRNASTRHLAAFQWVLGRV
ncbi:MAG: DUF2202 domain-containing protein [Bacillaceae bacterium]|nr:DUF2202 domain-containing protein [Bacillaceae bacterium]